MEEDKRGEKKESEWGSGLECSKMFLALIRIDFDSRGGNQIQVLHEHQRLGLFIVLTWSISSPLSQGQWKASENLKWSDIGFDSFLFN